LCFVVLQEVSEFADWHEGLQEIGYTVISKQKTAMKVDGVILAFKTDKYAIRRIHFLSVLCSLTLLPTLCCFASTLRSSVLFLGVCQIFTCS
jgi:hypothetical protein